MDCFGIALQEPPMKNDSHSCMYLFGKHVLRTYSLPEAAKYVNMKVKTQALPLRGLQSSGKEKHI